MKPVIVGATFIAAREGYRQSEITVSEVTVTQVGRKWATFSQADSTGRLFGAGRFDKNSGRIDSANFARAGRVFDDREAYDRHVRAKALWREFRRLVSDQWDAPGQVGEIEILKAADALGIRLKGE